MNASAHSTVSSTGCSAGKPSPSLPTGLPNNSRSDWVSVLTGFHSANGCNHPGSESSGTNALDRKVIGKIVVNATCCATSTVGTNCPTKTPIQDIAYANSSASAK